MEAKLKEKSTLKSRLNSFLLELDSFGHPITLKYNEHAEYRSILGGVTSFLVYLGIFIYSVIILNQTVNR
jgi:hypothetical protein